MRLSLVAAAGTFALGVWASPFTAEAQYRGRGDGGRSFDPSEMVRNLDANKNGQVEPSEMSSNRSAFWVRGVASRAGMDLTKPLPVDKLIEAMQRPRDERSRDGRRDNERSDDNDRDRGRDRDRDERRRDDERRSDGNSPSPPMGSPGVATFGTPTPGAPGATNVGADPLAAKYGERVVNYVNDMLQRYDKNNDSFVDNEEWKSGTWSTKPEESDLNKDNRLSKEELCIRIAKRFGSSSGGASSASSNSSSAAGNSEQVRGLAEGMMRQYDSDKDGKLQREEWMAMLPQHHSADTNSDGTITTEELAAKLTSYAGGSGTSSSPTFASTGASTGAQRRFRTPAERLPAGLPSWFFEKDANQDGQVMMSEYALRWSEEQAAEFGRRDLNGDGIITAKESLKANR